MGVVGRVALAVERRPRQAGRATAQFSGADLANVLNEAALLATRKAMTDITMAVVDEAIDRAILGITSRHQLMSEEERRVVAYHEAGHALVALAVEGAAPPYKVTILPRGATAGSCTMLDDKERVVPSRSAMLARMAVSVGGWAAEMLVFDEASAGSGSDLRRLNGLARSMVCELGMSEEFGSMLPVDERGYDGRPAPLSEEVTRAVRRLVEEATTTARATLTARRALLDQVSTSLLERETLTWADLDALVAAADRASGNGRRAALVPSPQTGINSTWTPAASASGRRSPGSDVKMSSSSPAAANRDVVRTIGQVRA